jgi:hypothetical protein
MNNRSLHLRQPTDSFRSSDQMTFSAHPIESLENRQNCTVQLLVITCIDALQFFLQDTKQIEACDCQSGESG